MSPTSWSAHVAISMWGGQLGSWLRSLGNMCLLYKQGVIKITACHSISGFTTVFQVVPDFKEGGEGLI